jgi:hypothetical protein
MIPFSHPRIYDEIIKELNTKLGGDIRVEEYYPFFQFTDFSTKIFHKTMTTGMSQLCAKIPLFL